MNTKQKTVPPRPATEPATPKQKPPSPPLAPSKLKTAPPPTAAANGSRLNGGRVDEKQLLSALAAFKHGDFSVRLPDDWTGMGGKIADCFNDVIGMNQRLARELDRIGQCVGKEGRISQRASIGDVGECWAEAIGSVHGMNGGPGASAGGEGGRHWAGPEGGFV